LATFLVTVLPCDVLCRPVSPPEPGTSLVQLIARC
jgi:hypothetical protein